MIKKSYSLLLAALCFLPLGAQIINPVTWSFTTSAPGNDRVDLVFTASVKSPWHMYGLHIPPGGPIATTISFDSLQGFEVLGPPSQQPAPKVVDDEIFNMKVELHEGRVVYRQRIRILHADSVTIRGRIEYMTCSDMQCIPGDQTFTFRLPGKPASAENPVANMQNRALTIPAGNLNRPETGSSTYSSLPPASSGNNERSLWGIFILAILAGLGGLLTPCVYPMIPMTVSYFMRNNKPRTTAISEALVFGLSIVGLYTLIGLLVAVFKNPNAVNAVTTHWITNIVFFTIFILLASSFFGAFEITLPSALSNRVDRQADKGGYAGAFFMALALAMLSFSCTGPIVASLLIKASQGQVLEPVVGMAGFSLVFALPFTLFAIFPAWLQKIPRSGSWLNAVKVFFAFIMLAFSLYFLSKVDQVYHINWLNREVFLSLWIVIFSLMGLYFLGKIRFAHDSDTGFLGVPRLLMAVASLSFAMYLGTGLGGNDLRGLSSILPPMGSSASAESGSSSLNLPSQNIKASSLCSTPKYADRLTLPWGLEGYFDYDEALACAREKNKPVLVDFVGHSCANCKKMYAEVWSDPRVLQLLREKFIIVALYTDDKTRLLSEEQIADTEGRVTGTLGKKNRNLQINRFQSNTLPLYAMVDGQGRNIVPTTYTYKPGAEAFLHWLSQALEQAPGETPM